MESDSKQPKPPEFHEGDLVETAYGDIGVVVGEYPIFELGQVDYYVKINGDIEIHRAAQLKLIQL